MVSHDIIQQARYHPAAHPVPHRLNTKSSLDHPIKLEELITERQSTLAILVSCDTDADQQPTAANDEHGSAATDSSCQ